MDAWLLLWKAVELDLPVMLAEKSKKNFIHSMNQLQMKAKLKTFNQSSKKLTYNFLISCSINKYMFLLKKVIPLG